MCKKKKKKESENILWKPTFANIVLVLAGTGSHTLCCHTIIIIIIIIIMIIIISQTLCAHLSGFITSLTVCWFTGRAKSWHPSHTNGLGYVFGWDSSPNWQISLGKRQQWPCQPRLILSASDSLTETTFFPLLFVCGRSKLSSITTVTHEMSNKEIRRWAGWHSCQ